MHGPGGKRKKGHWWGGEGHVVGANRIACRTRCPGRTGGNAAHELRFMPGSRQLFRFPLHCMNGLETSWVKQCLLHSRKRSVSQLAQGAGFDRRGLEQAAHDPPSLILRDEAFSALITEASLTSHAARWRSHMANRPLPASLPTQPNRQPVNQPLLCTYIPTVDTLCCAVLCCVQIRCAKNGLRIV